MATKLSKENQARIASRLPEGRTVDNVRIVTAHATVVDQDEMSAAEMDAFLASDVATAGGPPVISNGVPTVMRMVAWLGHEGMNNNRLAFIADELGPAADRIREPNFLLMDWNHSAVKSFTFDQKAIGVWYSAEKRWDPKARDGAGAYGILAKGVMWSWAFPEYANTMLAEQERKGVLEFSMACVPESVEIARDENGTYEIAHNPVFLTLSGLDVKPADPDAVGLGVEGSDDAGLEGRLQNQMTQDLAAVHAAALRVEEEQQMKELQDQIAALTAQLAEATSQIEKLTAAEIRATELEGANATLTTRIAELETQVTEITTVRDGLVSQIETITAAATEVETRLQAAETTLAAIAAAEETAQKAARYTARLAELPTPYVDALEKRSEEERTRFQAKWTDATDAEFAEFRADIELAFAGVKLSYLARSNSEGTGRLPQNGESSDIAETLRGIRK